MCKKLISLTPLIIVLGLVGNVTVVRATDWINAAGDGNWHTAGNWSSGLPNAGEKVIIESSTPMTWPTLDGGTADCARLSIGDTENMHGELTVTGGVTLKVNGELRLGRKESIPTPVGYLYISGSDTKIFVTDIIQCGRHGKGIIVMSGGYLHCDATLQMAYRFDGSAEVHLSGGTIDLSGNPGITAYANDGIPGTAFIDISGNGKITLAGNQISTIETLISGGEIIAYGGEGTVLVTYNGQTTTVTAMGLAEASKPNPADEATDVPRDVVLSWKAGEYVPAINGHKVYFSENFDDVNDGVGGVTQDANSYAPGHLDFGTTYYWRVDEVNGAPDYTAHEGNIWSFTTEPIGYAIGKVIPTASSVQQANMGPENTVNGSGLDADDLHSTVETNMWLSSTTGPQPTWIEYEFDSVYKLHEMWVWNSNQSLEQVVGLGLKDVTIEYSVDGADYTTLGTTHEFAQAPGTPDYAHNTTVDFGGVAAKYVRLTANSNWGGMLPQYGLSEVCFFYIPVRAKKPSPDSGATDVDVDVTLGWSAGREAARHNVYVSSDEQAVANGTADVTTVTETSYGPLSLDLGSTYYWRVDEVNEAEMPAMLEGDLWNFTTREFLVVDDFESYNDLDPEDPESKRIFNTWIDGYEQPANGSIVGYENAPFCERTIVHGGEQSMPLFYDNTGTARYSEAELTLSQPQDWTKSSVAALSLWFSGDPNNVPDQMYVKVNGSKVTYDGDAGNLTLRPWQPWNIDLADFAVNLSNVTELSIGLERIGLVGGSGLVYIDDIRLYPYSR